MLTKLMLAISIVLGATLSGFAEDKTMPVELEVLKSYVGVWDAEIEVWSAGPDSPSTKFKGVETNRPYGNHWIASDFDSEHIGQTIKVHSIVGFDVDKKQLVGTVIDDGPYAASMTGEYDPKSKTIAWMTHVKAPDGKPIVQKTVVTEKTADERQLVLSVPGKEKDEFTEFMRIKFVRRK